MSARSETQVKLKFSFPPRSNKNHTDQALILIPMITLESSKAKCEKRAKRGLKDERITGEILLKLN